MKILKEKSVAITLAVLIGIAGVYLFYLDLQEGGRLLLFTSTGIGGLFLPPAKREDPLLLSTVFITAFFIGGLKVATSSLILSYLFWGLFLRVPPKKLLIRSSSLLIPLLSGAIFYLKLGGSLPIEDITPKMAKEVAIFFFPPYLVASLLFLIGEKKKGDALFKRCAKGLHLFAFSLFLALFGAVIYYQIGLYGFIIALFIFLAIQGDMKQLVATKEELRRAFDDLSLIFSASQEIHLILEEERVIPSIFQTLSSFLPLSLLEVGTIHSPERLDLFIFDGKNLLKKGEEELTPEEKEYSEKEGSLLIKGKRIFAPLREGRAGKRYIRLHLASSPEEGSLKTLKILLPQIANALENARLYQEFREKMEKYQELSENLEKKIAEKTEALVRSEEELKKKNIELENFANTLSHDLKAPLVSISGFLEVIRKKYSDLLDEQGNHYLERIRSNIDYMNFLIRDLFELSRRGKSLAPLKRMEAAHIIYEALDRFQFQLREKKIEVKIEGKLPPIFCDRYRMIEVFTNLIENAIKYSDPAKKRKKIEIGAVEKSDSYQFFVRDNGIGIEKEKLKKLFKRGRKQGMGLLIVKEIIENHGGKVEVESSPGKGTTFYFTLPKIPPKMSSLA